MFGFGNKDKVRDPVCGMSVDLKKTKFKSKYRGMEYGFCSQGCKDNFDKNPTVYLNC